jgi:DNA-binding GntR family transcriptional regulator
VADGDGAARRGAADLAPTLAEDLARRLRRRILRGDPPPGAALKERETAASLGVSRTPMREAIRILAKEGLVTLRPARSPVVADPGFKEIADQVTVMMTLEILSAELACVEATVDDLAALRALHRRIEEGHAALDPLDLFEIDMAFHTAIAEASGNAALARTHRAYLARLWRARYLSARQRRNRALMLDQHSAILAALEARDPRRARRALTRHLGGLTDDIGRVLSNTATV